MKIAYAVRRCASYPYNGGGLPTDTADRQRFLEHAKKIGFDGIELPGMNLSDAEIEAFRSELLLIRQLRHRPTIRVEKARIVANLSRRGQAVKRVMKITCALRVP